MDIASFVEHFVAELKEENTAIFAGAGLSVASGYVDWIGLLEPLARQLGLDVDKEHDLVAVAQYHFNEHKRHALNQRLISQFSAGHEINQNHRALARLPIRTFWTTNYDRLIENALRDAGRRPDVKYTVNQLALTLPKRDAIVYKMHGDVEHPDNAVLTKDDYERYFRDWAPFVNALSGDLVSRTFLFLGFSFTDPNLDHVLSRIRLTFADNQRQHYFITKARSKSVRQTEEQFQYELLRQSFAVKDLRRFNIHSIIVNDYTDITSILDLIERRFAQGTVLISGSANNYGGFPEPIRFLENLSRALIDANYKIVTGFGLGVGSGVITGALQQIYGQGKTLHDELVLRPFPQGTDARTQWQQYRKDMIAHAGIAIFVFGNKLANDGTTLISADGVRTEFDIARDRGLALLPIGATGWVAEELWREVVGNIDRYYPQNDSDLKSALYSLGDKSLSSQQHVDNILRILTILRKSK